MKILLVMYMILYSHSAFHEMSHALAAYKLGIEIEKVKIGSEFMATKWGILSISPLLSRGYVDVAIDENVFGSFHRIFLFFEAGPAANLLLGIIFKMALHSIWGNIGFFVGLMMFIGNNLPFLKNTDGYMIWSNFGH